MDVYSRCYQYVDDITPLVKLLEELRRKSTEEVAHSITPHWTRQACVKAHVARVAFCLPQRKAVLTPGLVFS